MEHLCAVVLVEGSSDKVALETLAVRRGRDLAAEGVSVVAIGGAQAIGRFLGIYGLSGSNVALAGFCDVGEEGAFRRALERAGLGTELDRVELERLGFFVCDRDLEDELVRSLGVGAMEDLLSAHGKLGSFRTYQRQPAHRGRATEDQLRGFSHELEGRARRPARRRAGSRPRAAPAGRRAGSRRAISLGRVAAACHDETQGEASVYIFGAILVVVILVAAWWLLYRALNGDQEPTAGGPFGDLVLGEKNTRKSRER